MSTTENFDAHPSFDPLRPLLEQPGLVPLLPMLYVAWSDGDLGDEEIGLLRGLVHGLPWVGKGGHEVLDQWLDPKAPPSPVAVQCLLHAIRNLSPGITDTASMSLADLSLELAAVVELDKRKDWKAVEVRKAFEALEVALGVVGEEATREIASQLAPPAPEHPEIGAPRFDVDAITALFDGKFADVRQEVRELLAGPDFGFVYGLELAEHREEVMKWVGALAKAGFGEKCFPKRNGGAHPDMGEFLAIFETLGFFDLNLPVKFGVQFGLFGGSIFFLGTEKHHAKYLPKVATLELQGCYAMTEMGRGSNVRDLETTATYDKETGEFVIHTPTESARKEWIGGAGRYATMATVYAQLEVDGEHYGVHAFLVPIRDGRGKPLKGVTLEDMGLKMGLNGVDNGRIWFDKVRIPRENLLDRYGRVTEEGVYESPIPSSNKRFFTMLGTLVAGRLGVASAGLSAAKTGLAIAVRYGANRAQFGPTGKPEIPILDYRMHQRSLLPQVATAYALSFALKKLASRYNDADEENRREVEALAAGLKAYGTWFAVDAIQAARECCGGQGYLSVNRLPGLRADVDVFVTFEGANVVMMQQVAKARLTEYRHELADANIFTMARFLARHARRTLSETNPITTRLTDEAHLRDPAFQLSAFRYRESDQVISVARRLKRRLDEGWDSFEAFNDVQDHVLCLADAYIERFILESFVEAVETCEDEAVKEQLKNLCDLFALTRIEKDFGWFLENNYIANNKARAIRDLVNDLLATVRQDAVHLVDAFGIPDNCLSAPIAFANGKEPAEARVDYARGLAKP